VAPVWTYAPSTRGTCLWYVRIVRYRTDLDIPCVVAVLRHKLAEDLDKAYQQACEVAPMTLVGRGCARFPRPALACRADHR